MTDKLVIQYDRSRGALIGLAVGDALGAAVEFKRPGTFKPVVGYRGGSPHPIERGDWTDDTSMALALADSIASVGWDLNDQATRYLHWWQDGEYSVVGHCFDIGNATQAALSRFKKTRNAHTSGDPSSRASGNGSIMRLAPVPIRFSSLFPDRIDELSRLAAESSLPTHASPQCLSACRYLTLVLCGLINGLDRQTVLSPDWPPLMQLRKMEPLHPEIDAVAMGSYREKQPPQITGSGYVVASLEAALWAFHSAIDFRAAVLRAVNLGDDADTTGAICGQLAGAHWGESGIPNEWREGLGRKDMIERALGGLLQPTTSSSVSPKSPGLALAGANDLPPTERSFWVLPKQLLAGGYPGSPNVQKHRQRIEALWQAGIRTFISLMEEHETNNDGQPFTPYDGVLRELAARDGETVNCLRFPVRDVSIPKEGVMHSILNAIDASLAASRPVFLHCFGGVGRTGTAVCCWLQRHGLATPANVLEALHGLRQADKLTIHRAAPETSEQIAFVMKWR